MALFEYFPNCTLSLSVSIAMEKGGKIGEIVDMCAPIKAAFMREWVKIADKLAGLPGDDEAKVRLLSAGEKPRRAALY